MTTATEARSETAWHAVASLGLGAFAIVSAEFLPVGVLPTVARDVDISLGLASSVVLVPGLVAALVAPFIVTAVGHLDRKILIASTTALLLLSDLGTCLIHGFPALMVCRVLLGVSLGGFWAVGPSLGGRLATPARQELATSIVVAGISAGTVLGLPVGQLVATGFGWRNAFLGAAGLALVAVVLQVSWLPKIPSTIRITGTTLLGVIHKRSSRFVLIATLVVFTSQIMTQTYIGAYLAGVDHTSATYATLALLTYGGAGIGGNLLTARIPLPWGRLLAIAAFLMCVTVAVLPAVQGRAVVAELVIALWGFTWGAVPLILQSWMISAVPDEPEAGSAVLVTVLQGSIALGSLLGGVVISVGDLSTVFYVGAVGLLLTAGLSLRESRRPGRAETDGQVEAATAVRPAQ
jgi:predicted MFS family arabinose efflux permease